MFQYLLQYKEDFLYPYLLASCDRVADMAERARLVSGARSVMIVPR